MSEWRYDENSGSFRRSDGYSSGSYNSYSRGPKKEGGDWGGWVLIGILFAFGWLYPDVPMYILFIPVPIRARIFVIIYALIELFAGLGSVVGLTADNVAHFAHLGGLLFGWLLILYWKKTNWREPGELWEDLCSKFGGHRRLDSTNDKSKFDDYHYHKRV